MQTTILKQKRFLVLVLLAFFALATAWLDKPFTGHHDWDNVLYTYAVQNYLEYGYSELEYIQVYSPLKSLPEDLDRSGAYVYRHNPPTIALVQSLSVRAFSFSEAFIRLPNIFLTLFSIVIFYQLGRVMYGKAVGIRAAFFFALAPLVVYFSRTVNHEAGNIMFANALILVYILWLRTQKTSWFIWACLIAIMGIWYGHFMAFFLALLFPYSLIFGNRQEKIMTLVICIVGFIAFVVWMTYTTRMFDAYIIDEFIEIYTIRTSDQSNGEGDTTFNMLEYVIRMFARIFYGFSFFAFVFAMVGIYALHKKGNNREDYLLWVHLIAGLVYTTLWRNATWIHDYFTYYVVAPLAMWAGYGLYLIWPHGGIPKNRLQRVAWGGLLGHVVIILIVIVGLIGFSNRSFLKTANIIKTRTTADELIATNLRYRGPHIGYYAERDITFDIKFNNSVFESVFAEDQFEMYLVCNLRDEPNWPDTVQVEKVENCYAVRPASSN